MPIKKKLHNLVVKQRVAHQALLQPARRRRQSDGWIVEKDELGRFVRKFRSWLIFFLNFLLWGLGFFLVFFIFVAKVLEFEIWFGDERALVLEKVKVGGAIQGAMSWRNFHDWIIPKEKKKEEKSNFDSRG